MTSLTFIRSALPIATALLFSSLVFTQELPKKIRGYKVYQANVKVQNGANAVGPSGRIDAIVDISDPTVVDVGLAGVTFEVDAAIAKLDQSGRIDMLMFRDFRINGIAVSIEEYNHAFTFKRGKRITLPSPAHVLIPSTSIVKAALRELVESNDDWTVTGTVFVFGKFNRFGIGFKRVVPVEIRLTIRNPVKSLIRAQN